MDAVPPTGTVSFLFTDVERSTAKWESHPQEMAAAMVRHDQLLRAAMTAHRGFVFSTSGDGMAAAFWTPRDAVDAAREIQTRLAAEAWPGGLRVTVRIGIHTGTADERDGDYFGPTLNRAARIMDAGHGGQVLLSAITAQLIGSGELVDLGEQRLKDLAAPERIFQVGSRTFPPLRTSGSLTVRLPEWDTRFWGRTAEMAEVKDRVVRSRVVVLTGPGGLGKTRLAAQVAQQLVGEFASGIYFVGLAGIVADAVDYAVADGVGVRRELHRSPVESLVAWLGERAVLIVLDNCEEVVPAARGAVEVLVERCPRLHVLVTSRVPLRVPGEVRIPLKPLGRPAAVELFLDRLPTVAATVDEPSTRVSIDDLCQRLDGVPLALELAAARCRTLTPHELLARLEHRPELLTDTSGLFDERHRDLDRLVDWSWHELSPAARRVLGRLTVVIGGVTLDGAEAIAGGDGVDDVEVALALEELEDSGLIIREQVGIDVRHRLLEPIRQRVAAFVDDSEHARAARRHAAWFTRLAECVRAGSVGPDFGRWADLVEYELPNFRQAHRLVTDSEDVSAAVAIVDGLSVVGHERGLMELADWCDTTVEMVKGREDALELAAVSAAARFWWLQNRVDEIPEAGERLASVIGAAEHHLLIEEAVARATLDPERWSDAVDRLQRALDRYGQGEPCWGKGQVALYLVLLGGLTESDIDKVDAWSASPVFSATLAFYRAVPYYMEDEDAFAAELAGEAVALARAAGATFQLATALMGHGGWRARVPEYSDAEVFEPLIESLDLWDRLRIPWGRIGMLEEIAQARAIRGDPESAFVLWGAVDATRIQAPAKVGRRRRTAASVVDIPVAQSDAWMTQGAAMSLDHAVMYARRLLRPAPDA